MVFRSINEIEDALRSANLSVRALHEIWDQRFPVPEPSPRNPAHGSNGQSIEWIQEDLRLASRFVRHAFEREDFQLVCDAAREVLRYWSQEGKDASRECANVRMHLASALTRLGYLQEARRELYECLGSSPAIARKAEIFRLIGEADRDDALRAPDRAAAVQQIEAALKAYQQVHELDPGSLEALTWMAAGTMYVAREHTTRRDKGRGYARQLLELASAQESAEGQRFALALARAEALLLLGREDEAASAYQALREVEDRSVSRLAEARYRTQFIADALDKPRDFLKAAFPPLHLIVFAGHLPDLPNRAGQPPRFPADLVDPVRDRLRQQLEEVQAHIGICSAAAGADLLFLDELQSRPDSMFHIVLPWSEDEFRETSVRRYEPRAAAPIWEPLFDRAVETAATVRELGEFYEPSDSIGWRYMAEVTAGLALHTAKMLRLDLQPVALWDKQPGRGAGGTEDFVSFWRGQLGHEPLIIDMPRPREASARPAGLGTARRVEHSALHHEVKTMLFADIVGYSKLKETVIPAFVTCFLDRVSQLTATSRHAPQTVNTWGDAVYAVFDFAVDAGNFALELARMIHDNKAELLEHELYWEEPAANGAPAVKHPLNIRIGLHTGPVFMHHDPVVRQLGYTGAHVSRAARIEPITVPGDVFASEEFTAFAELDTAARAHRGEPNAAEFLCEYAGSMALAKGYPGRYRIYRLVPGRRLDIEELAKAIHCLYCEEARKRNETPETNRALRSWAELSENMREANREQAAAIPGKLRVLGYELTHRGGIKPAEMVLDSDRIEQIAKDEHLRWMAERQRQGWTFAAERDDEKKRHPLLISWEQLSEKERNKDRDTVRNLPALVEKAGFRLRSIGGVG